MRPLKLQLQGFSCFREPTEVSFEELELFAISGATGAGKSTLLDAITYALYGQTARIGAQLKDTLFSPGLEQLSVTLEFRTDQANTYRVTRVSERKGGRAPKNETRISRLEGGAQWKQLPESEKLAEANDKLKEIVGLDYDSFTRAVLLPQGDFDQFLRGSANERIKLLTSLLGLERVQAMQQRAGERARSAREREKSLRERLEGDYAGATPERKRTLKGELVALEGERGALSKRRAALSDQLQALGALQQLFAAKAEVQARLIALEGQRESVAAAQGALGRARAPDRVLPYLDELEKQRARAAQETAKRDLLAERLGAAEAAFEGVQQAFHNAQNAAERVPDVTARLEALAGVRPQLAQLKQRGGDLALAEPSHPTPPVSYTDDAWDALQVLASQLPSLKRVQGDVLEAQRAVGRAERELAETGAALNAAHTTLEELKREGQASKARLEEARKRYEAARTEDQAAALRPHLHLGEACPVCEQTVQTLPSAGESRVSELKAAYEALEARHKALQERYLEEDGTRKALRSRQEDRQEELGRAKTAMERQQARLGDAETAFASLGTNDPTELETHLQRQRYALLVGLATEIAGKTGGLDPEAAYVSLSQERKALEEALQATQTRFYAAQRELDALRAEGRALHTRLAELAEDQRSAERSFAERLGQSIFKDAEAVRGAALSEARQQELEMRTLRHARDQEALERREVELEAELAGRTFDPAQLDAAKRDQGEAERALEAAQQRAGELQGELARLEVQLERAKELREEAKTLLAVAVTYGALDRDLQRKNFPTYLLERVQRELALRASDILKEVTENRYDLRFGDGEYNVLDAWSGETRSTKTLSGGESFITSLALALALSDTLSGSTSLGALFLDEGFGTLDADTLEAVTGVLESLTSSGRMVGVITHVASLTSRLPARLEVRKGLTGSVVSWDG